ncbi:DUF1589 domain-containing protein [Rhodopirellula baltica]
MGTKRAVQPAPQESTRAVQSPSQEQPGLRPTTHPDATRRVSKATPAVAGFAKNSDLTVSNIEIPSSPAT